jgi:cytochrome oxidase Cu insertion factor (SCO1/SenC/PrrC family)
VSDSHSLPNRRFPLPSRFQLALTLVLVAAVAVVGTITVVRKDSVNSAVTAATTRDDFMGLASAQGALAPDISLGDQSGQTVSLSGLEHQGKVIVLEFMDSHCTDICPIISQEFVVAHRQLGADASKVAFVAVNVNPFHLAQSDVAAFTDEQGLSEVPEWHFLTGSIAQLQDAWKKYGVAVQAPNPNVDVVHSDNMYFIDSTGHQRWIALPTDDHTASGASYLPAAQVRQWGVDIASVVHQMLG